MSEEPVQFSREVIIAQLAARASLRRGLAIIAICLIGSWLMIYLAMTRFGLPDDLWFASVFLSLVATLVAIRQLQWSVLASHGLRCPSCGHFLAAERRWWRSPKPFCKVCGKLAILPNSILDDAAAN